MSFDTYELENDVIVDDPFFIDYDVTSVMFYIEL